MTRTNLSQQNAKQHVATMSATTTEQIMHAANTEYTYTDTDTDTFTDTNTDTYTRC